MPPDTLTVVAAVVIGVVVLDIESDAGLAEADGSVARTTLTEQVAVAICPKASVTVQSSVPDSVAPGERLDPVQFVVAAAGALIAIPEPPDCHVHSITYGPAPPAIVAVTLPVLSTDEAPSTESEFVESETLGAETLRMLTDTFAVALCPAESVAVHCATPLKVEPRAIPVAVNVVAFAAGELIVMPAPPESHAQE